MSISIVQLGTERGKNEGLRIGTVRRPPRGVPKSEFSRKNYYDTWLPILSPSEGLVAIAKSAQESEDEKEWKKFKTKFIAELKKPDASRTLDLLAALSHQTNFAIGCYCENEERCHRSILREVLKEKGAKIE